MYTCASTFVNVVSQGEQGAVDGECGSQSLEGCTFTPLACAALHCSCRCPSSFSQSCYSSSNHHHISVLTLLAVAAQLNDLLTGLLSPPHTMRSTKAVMRDRLLFAVREGQGSFDLS